MLFTVTWNEAGKNRHSIATSSGHTVQSLYTLLKDNYFHVYTEEGIELDPERGLQTKQEIESCQHILSPNE